MSGQCTCRHKQTPRDDAFQADLQKRLNRAIGQLNGIKTMIDDNRYCGESAVRKVSELVLKNHLETSVVQQIRQGNDQVVEEALGLIKRFMR